MILSARGAAPTLDFLLPAGGKRGTDFIVTVGGKHDPWPVLAWSDTPDLKFTAEKDKDKFHVEIGATTPPGPHLVRLYSPEGASELKVFVVGEAEEISEKEPNDKLDDAQKVENLPVVLNGRLERNGDVDSFAIRVGASQWINASLDGYGLGSPMDPSLHLFDEHHVRIAFNHDTRNLDPAIAFRSENGGLYILQLVAFAHPPQANVGFTGSPACVYRLTLRNTPPAKPTPPESGEKSVAEIEPNNTPAQAQRISIPCDLAGAISSGGDVDRFSFNVKKGEDLWFRVYSARYGSPLDAELRIEDSSGKQLTENDDAQGSTDPSLDWKAPADGVYLASIGDVMHQGGSNYLYRLEIGPPVPDFSVTIDNHAFQIEPGKTNELKVAIKRAHGHKEVLILSAEGLPSGISIQELTVPEQAGEVKVSLVADANASPSQGAFRIHVLEKGSDRVHNARFSLKPLDDKGGDRLINETDQLWLTVIGPVKK